MAGTAIQVSNSGTPTGGSNPWIDSLVWGNAAWADNPGTNDGKPTITYVLANSIPGSDNLPGATKSWATFEADATRKALSAWSAVANIEFVESVSWTSSDFYLSLRSNLPNAWSDTLGQSEIPVPGAGEPLHAFFNSDHYTWTANSLKKGGLSYVVLLHELGHMLGLAHPHDGGLQPDATTFPEVEKAFNDFGQFYLNQGIFTTMTYNDGWASQFPGHRSINYGLQATPMALDIAAIQLIYGANMSYRTGNDTYTLPAANQSGTYWSCIWDAGGTDTITNAGRTRACTIDLREATLVDENAGGFVSRANGVVGGFTIAHNVTIENAIGGKAGDKITGNFWNNLLNGGLGNDTIKGWDGADTVNGGGGNDRLFDTNTFGSNTLSGGSGHDLVTGGMDTDTIMGGLGNDTLDGGQDNDRIIGGAGTDILTGGLGADTFVFDDGNSVRGTARDRITDFAGASDILDLGLIDADNSLAGDQGFVFTDTTAAAHSVWYSVVGSGIIVAGDVNGDGVADFEILLSGVGSIAGSDLLL